MPFIHEMDDGDDTLNWIAVQPWSNGRIGMIGPSYMGVVQWAAAASGNSHLKALVSQVTAHPITFKLPRKGGIILSSELPWCFLMAEKRANQDAKVRDDWDEVKNIRPIKDIFKKVLGKDLYFWNQWMEHPDYDEFWKKSDCSLYALAPVSGCWVLR